MREFHGLPRVSTDIELKPEAGTDGWAVYTGCDGEDPRFVGFFLKKQEAELMLRARDPEDNSPVYSEGDSTVELAILTERGIVTANDYTITDHAQLRARIAGAL